ncbi:MAG: DUF6484 domain-containing protein [Aquabacterium sp.]
MRISDLPELPSAQPSEPPAHAAERDDLLSPLLQGPATSLGEATQPAAPLQGPIHGVIVGTLLALADNGLTALVSFPGQPGAAALRARSVVDLHGPHMGQGVVLMFEQGDVHKPIVMGVLRGQAGWPLPQQPATVDVDADGRRMVVSASEQLVLRCGKASITLTKAGKVLIDGTYVLNRSSGVNRIKGGSVQLN